MHGQTGNWPAATDVDRRHAQLASRIERLMIACAHPMAQEFCEYRDFFEALPTASHAATRFVSYLDAENCIELGRPLLGMAGIPCPADPREQPALDAAAERRVLVAANDGWQDWAPDLVRGFWIVRSTDRRMAHMVEGVSGRIQSIRLKDRYVARLYRPTRAEFAALIEIAGTWQPDGLMTGGVAPPAPACHSPAPLSIRAHDLACWADRTDAWL